jgi:hypothetical protein
LSGNHPLRIFVLVLGLAFPLSAGSAAAQTWQIDYDPALGTKPSAQGWTHYSSDPLPDDGIDETSYWVALGVLAQGDTGGPNTDLANHSTTTCRHRSSRSGTA